MIVGDYNLTGAVATAWSGGPPVARFPVAGSPYLSKVTVRLVGDGSAGSGTATVLGTLKDPDGNTITTSSEIVVTWGDPAAWLDLSFEADPPQLIGDGVWEVVLSVPAGLSTVPRWMKVTPVYDGGSDNVANFASVFEDFKPNADVRKFDIARLPYAEAQRYLTDGGRDGPPHLTTLGWHGQAADPRIGSYALVSPYGPLAGTAGRVLRITPRDGSGRPPIYAYVLSDQAAIEDDPLTVTRHLYQQIALASDYDYPVTVEVVPA